MFRFVQLEFGHALGPADGRYLTRAREGADPSQVIVLMTLGAPQRRLMRGKKPTAVTDAGPEPVPTARATLVAAEPFESDAAAKSWLETLRRDDDAVAAEVDDAVAQLNRVLRAHRAATLDHHVREVSAAGALVVRVGYGNGDQVADGRFTAAYELPREASGQIRRGAARRRAAIAPQERLAAILSGRDRTLAGEELLLRARADLDAHHPREAALQARVALEALIADLGREGRDVADLSARRGAVGDAANAALEGDPSTEQTAAVTDAVEAMDRALRHRATSL